MDIDLLHMETMDAEDIESVTDSRSTRVYALPEAGDEGVVIGCNGYIYAHLV